MTRQEAIDDWIQILPAVFNAEEKLRPQLKAMLEQHKDNKAESAELYCRMIAEEIVSHTSDDELAQL